MTTASTMDSDLREVDPDIADAVERELGRQRDTLELIASENFAPLAVLQAQGSVLTNKYAEGYPGRRYYGGCEYVDVVESLAIERAKRPWSQGINATPRLDPVGFGRRWLNRSDLGRGETADRRAVGRGCAGVAVASGDQPVAVCHPACGDRVAAAGQAGAGTLAAAVVAG